MNDNPPGRRAVSERLAASTMFLLLFLVYTLAVRAFDYLDLADAGAVDGSVPGPPFSLLFLLGQELLPGLFFAALIYGAWPRRPVRYAVLLLACLYMVWLALDQLAFQFFFTHVDYVLFSDSHDLENLSSSFWESLDFPFWTLVGLALVVTGIMFVGRFGSRVGVLAGWIGRRPLVFAAACAVYAALTFTLCRVADQYGLEKSFPVAYATSYLDAMEEEAMIERVAARVREGGIAPDRDPVADAGRGDDAGTAVEGARRLNVVWYLMESTSFRESSMFPGARYDTTPFLKELAGRSLFFDNYYTIVAASTRSFFSALTGVYPYMDRSSDLSRYSRVQVPNLPDILHDEGYTTAFFANSDSMFEGLDSYVSSRAFDHYMDKNLVPPEELPGESRAYWGLDEEVMIDRALDWVASVADSGKPFYLSYNAVYPHHPFRVPASNGDLMEMDWGEPRERFLFRASLAYADRSVKRMFEGLERMGLTGDTLFIVTPDHGEAFGDLHRKNYIHAEYCYEEDSRIFLIMHNPGVLGDPATVSRLGSHLDILPTVLDVLGIRRDLDIDGRSLLDADRSDRPLFHFSRRQIAMRDGTNKFLMMRTRGDGPPEIYDLSKDPEEQENLAAARPDLVAGYRERTLEWQARVAMAFKERCALAGMTPSEMADAADRKRREMFASTQVKLGSYSVCPGAGNTSCSGGVGTFTRGQPITVRATLARPADAEMRLSLYHSKGERIWGETKRAEGRKEAVFTMPTADLVPGERYRLKVSSLYYKAVHDTRWFPFYVK